MRLSVKSLVTTLLLSIPCNFILIEGIGNVYLSSVILILNFIGLFFLTKGKILLNQYAQFAMFVFLTTLVVSITNIVYSDPELINFQITNTVIYFQSLLAFILALYFYNRIDYDFFFKLFLLIVFLATVRLVIEEPNHILKLSIRWEERIEIFFIGGVNNFALFLGIAFIISFFYLKSNMKRIIFCLFFLTMIVLSMSRGALLGVILTIFLTSFYDTNRKTFKQLIRYTLYSILGGVVLLYTTGKIGFLLEKINERFFSLFTGEKKANDFFSARGDLLVEIFNKLCDSSIFQILFGHGNGGIDFYNKASNQFYETSHNILVDILYRNGMVMLILYVLIFSYILLLFIKYRNREKLVLFGIFVFFHLELLVNPILFAAQTGWIYAIFMVYFLKQNQLFLKNKTS